METLKNYSFFIIIMAKKSEKVENKEEYNLLEWLKKTFPNVEKKIIEDYAKVLENDEEEVFRLMCAMMFGFVDL